VTRALRRSPFYLDQTAMIYLRASLLLSVFQALNFARACRRCSVHVETDNDLTRIGPQSVGANGGVRCVLAGRC
jgi:hypothetical protein